MHVYVDLVLIALMRVSLFKRLGSIVCHPLNGLMCFWLCHDKSNQNFRRKIFQKIFSLYVEYMLQIVIYICCKHQSMDIFFLFCFDGLFHLLLLYLGIFFWMMVIYLLIDETNCWQHTHTHARILNNMHRIDFEFEAVSHHSWRLEDEDETEGDVEVEWKHCFFYRVFSVRWQWMWH